MSKRANGEGTVYQRNDGRWVAVIPLENGKRKFIYRKTQREAIKALQLSNQAKMQGTFITTGEQTLEAFLTRWLQETAQPNVRPRTFIRYRELIQLHILPVLGKVKLQKLSPQHLQKLYNQKLEQGSAPQSVKHMHRLLHKALNDALKWNLISRNVCNLVDTPRVPKHEMKVFTSEQAQKFLDVAKGDPLEALYVVALTTGMRQGELLALKWDDIDFSNGKLQVRRTIARITNKGFTISEPKTPKSRRSINLTPMAIESLKQHRIRQHEKRLLAGPAWDEQGWVYVNALGRPIEVGNMMRRSFLPLLVKAELPKIRFHDLRHSTATLLLSMGTHPKIVQELLGHSQISMTLDTYSHVLPSLQEDAMSRLNTLLTKSS
jgi:integrase